MSNKLPKGFFGVVLCSLGSGMLIVTLIPRWCGILSALVLVVVGVLLLLPKC